MTTARVSRRRQVVRRSAGPSRRRPRGLRRRGRRPRRRQRRREEHRSSRSSAAFTRRTAARCSSDGEPVRLSPADRRSSGVETVYQDLALCDNLDAIANVQLGREPVRFRVGPFKFIDRRAAESSARQSHRGGRRAHPGPSCGRPSTLRRPAPSHRHRSGDRRWRAESSCWTSRRRPSDSPRRTRRSSSSEPSRAQGLGVVMISHNLEDVFGVCDRIVGLRLGFVTLDSPVAATTHEKVIACMTMGQALRRRSPAA